MKKILLYIVALLGIFGEARSQDNFEIPKDAVLRFIRIYGDNELEPPVLNVGLNAQYNTNVGSEKITVELDVSANVPPNLYAKFVHYTADWRETENLFYQDLINTRFSNIDWRTATYSNSYFSHRAFFTFPDLRIKFKHSGNWKVIFYEYDKDTVAFAEAKFFVIEQRAAAELSIWNSMYAPKYSVASTCYNIEARVWSKVNLLDNNVHSCVLYRNNRFEEPLIISQRNDIDNFDYVYKYRFNKSISGFMGSQKAFRIEGIPAENEYRVLDLTNTGYFPRTTSPVRLPLSDLRRNGSFYDYDNEGVMMASRVPSVYDDYVYVEFLLDPDGVVSSEDVFITGSFNNWSPSGSWMMHYDAEDRYYKLRQWIRRGVHNYLYATGELNFLQNKAVRYSTDQYEGNTTLNDHYFIAFVYYKDVALGGYDAIIAATKQSISYRY